MMLDIGFGVILLVPFEGQALRCNAWTALSAVHLEPVQELNPILPYRGLAFEGALNGFRGEVVNNRVKATIGHSDTQSDRIQRPDHELRIASLEAFGADQGVEDEIDVVRDETEAEDE